MSDNNRGYHNNVYDILDNVPAHEAEDAHNNWLDEISATLVKALESYQMPAEILDARLTPNAALIRLRGQDALTIEKIERRTSTLYTSWGLEIISVRPGKGFISFMIARDDRVILPTADMWKRRNFNANAPRQNTSFIIGEREDNGELLYINLAEANDGQSISGPHTLIAGETGGGKGILTSNIMLEICATNTPDNARLIVIDPKSGVDYNWIEKVPHLEGPIITSPADSLLVYSQIVDEMNRRYEQLLAPNRAPSIDAYNNKVSAAERIPRIYVFHDEMADWMTDDDYRKEATESLTRLSVKGRAAGIHLFFVTQRPDKKALPGAIKANVSNKICLRVSNKVNSNIVIDETGAEELLGQGHMMAQLGGMRGGPVFAQAPYLDPWEAEMIALAIADNVEAGEPVFNFNFLLEEDENICLNADNDDEDIAQAV